MMLIRVAEGLAARGHEVHVINCHDREETRHGVMWWPQDGFPHKADVVVGVNDQSQIADVKAPLAVAMITPIDPPMPEPPDIVDRWVCLSQFHAETFKRLHPDVEPDRVYIVPPGIDPAPLAEKVPNQLIFGSSPDRGLWHMPGIMRRVREDIPDATLKVTYNVRKMIGERKWESNAFAQLLLEIEDAADEGLIELLPEMTRAELRTVQAQSQMLVFPYDPLVPGSDYFSITTMECCAVGAPPLLVKRSKPPSLAVFLR